MKKNYKIIFEKIEHKNRWSYEYKLYSNNEEVVSYSFNSPLYNYEKQIIDNYETDKPFLQKYEYVNFNKK